MREVSLKHNRKSIRLKGYNYSQPGAYFVTICVKDQRCILGMVKENNLILSEIGEIVAACWKQLPIHFQRIYLDEFVVMSNHLHGIIFLVTQDDGEAFKRGSRPIALTSSANAPLLHQPRGTRRGSLGGDHSKF